jgi:SWI/SNF-related matrix-associated actin-dependent regulator of chromatin subfamily A3
VGVASLCDELVLCGGQFQFVRDSRFASKSSIFCSSRRRNECLPHYEADVKETRVGNKAQCPLCENVIHGSFLASKEKRGRKLSACLPVSPVPLAAFRANCSYSTELAAVVQEIESQGESDKRRCPLSWSMYLKAPANYVVRSIVFSAWKKGLDLVAYLLSAKTILFTTIDGSLSLLDRRKVLSNFKSKPDIKVLMMTLGTSAVGHMPPPYLSSSLFINLNSCALLGSRSR